MLHHKMVGNVNGHSHTIHKGDFFLLLFLPVLYRILYQTEKKGLKKVNFILHQVINELYNRFILIINSQEFLIQNPNLSQN